MMKSKSKIGFCLLLACFAVISSVFNACAFSLLGPFEPWMEYTNGLRQPGYIYLGGGQILPEDIGGPMDITNEYRWNVSVVTYGFDQSFLDYFGTNGVATVESAIQILNNLPPASQIVPTNFPLDTTRINYEAQSLSLYDLKSETLSLLLEQMGLTQPTRYIYVLRQWDPVFLPPWPYNRYSSPIDWPDWVYPDFIAQRNFDPQTLSAGQYVNDTVYTAEIFNEGNQNTIIPYAVDPFDNIYTAVADFPQGAGVFYSGLTEDDVGGLAYLLSTNNVNFETLPPGVSGVGTNADSYVNGARRPGIDKITFMPQPVNSLTGAFLLMTNQFTDSYFTNGVLMQQQLARVISQPDFLFSAKNFKEMISSPDVSRTGTTNWINNAALNGNPTGAGPGVIQPPITITFNIAGRQYVHGNTDSDESVYDETSLWGTFDGSTNTPFIYPVPSTGTNQMTVQMLLVMGKFSSFRSNFEWTLADSAGSLYNFQTSTNLSSWITLFTVTNDSAICGFYNWNPSSPTRFYRLVPQ